MSKIDEIRKRHEELTGKLARLGRHAGLIESAQKAHDDRGELLTVLDGGWQSERPGPGSWNLSIPPDRRFPINGCIEYPWPAVVPCEVIGGYGGELFVQFSPDGEAFPVDRYAGAKWQRRTVPADPFGGDGG